MRPSSFAPEKTENRSPTAYFRNRRSFSPDTGPSTCGARSKCENHFLQADLALLIFARIDRPPLRPHPLAYSIAPGAKVQKSMNTFGGSAKSSMRHVSVRHRLRQERQRYLVPAEFGLADQGSNRGLARCARSSACCGNQAPAIGSSRPHSGSKIAWPAAFVGHPGCV